MSAKLFQKYHKKLSKEGILKAFLNGLSIGAGVLLISSFIVWMTNPNLFWVAIVAFVASTAGCTALLYYKKYQPTTKAIARRVDDLGLEERLLTMLELEKDDSYIAQRQREDALNALSKIDSDLLKIVVSTATILVASCVGLAALGMNTVSLLSSVNVLPSGIELWEQLFGVPPVTYEITYAVDGEGQLIFEDGKTISNGESYTVSVIEGADSGKVYAQSSNEWVFIEWLDGYQYPTRTERNVQKRMTLTVVFAEISGSAGNGSAMDMPDDLPPQEGQDGKPTQGKPNSSSPGGSYEPSNQIIDNKTYYGDEYDAAYDKIQKEMEQDREMLEDQKDITSGYLGGIKADAEEKEEGNN